MDLEYEIKRVAETYEAHGYEVTSWPTAEDLPEYAKDFTVELLGKRGNEGVLVSVKKDRGEVAADPNLTRYAEVTHAQKGWRFDLAILEAEKPNAKDIDGAMDFSEQDVERSFSESLDLVDRGFLRPAVITAWAAFESAMRQRLRAAGERAGWGSSPRSMLNELYSNGMIDRDEFLRLEALSRLRNQIVHGFVSTVGSEAEAVPFLCGVGRRLIEESRLARAMA
jgi:HEPN domain-containing protein